MPLTNARDEELALLFSEAQTHNFWLDRPVSDDVLRRAYDLAKMAPTAANTQPLRIVFMKSAAGKEKLKATLSPTNVDKTMAAPATAIIAYDSAYWEQMDKLFPARPEMKGFLGGLPPEVQKAMGTLSATLQAGYFILAARALGLDCGPMGGFEAAKVDAAFLDGAKSKWKSLLLVNLGYGDTTKLYPRNPRLSFDDAATIE